MTSVPPSIAAEAQLTRQNIALSVIKSSADQAEALVEILDDASRSAPVSSARGSNVNLTA